jgi:hypothetical protein
MKIEKLAPGMTVYDCHKYKTNGGTNWGTWSIKIISVDVENGEVVAEWNNNKAQIFTEFHWKKWTLEKPLLISHGFMRNRKATAAEKKAHKEKQEKQN